MKHSYMFIKHTKIMDVNEFHEYMAKIRELWWANDCLWKVTGDRYEISTGGWSDNEEILSLMMQNLSLNIFYWQQSQRGGHYVFEPLPRAEVVFGKVEP